MKNTKSASSATSITLFGIPNCDTVKKARTWLEAQAIPVHFHNFKKDGLNQATVEAWLETQSLDVLINRKGTTWRALSDAQKQLADEKHSAIALILAQPSLIKRPVLQIETSQNCVVQVGFNEALYQSTFQTQI